MNDTDLGQLVRDAFEREAVSAPPPTGLLDAIASRRRRRKRRDSLVAGALVIGVATSGFALWPRVVPSSAPPPVSVPGSVPGSAPDSVSEFAAPGAFAAPRIDVCLTYHGGRVAELRFTARMADGTVERTVQQSDESGILQGRVEQNDRYTMDLGVIQTAPAKLSSLTASRPLEVDGHNGMLATEWAGRRVLYFDANKAESSLWLRVTRPGPTDDQLVSVAKKVHLSEEPHACD